MLLSPGPAATSDRVKQALLRGDWCHREKEFSALQAAIRTDLTRVLEVEQTHETILVTGSGTAAMEMAVIGSVRAGRSLLAVRNGVYGDRIAQIAEVHGIRVHSICGSWTHPVDPEAVRAALRAHPDIDAVACVQHETTTGLINPVDCVGEIARSSGALYIVDAISATAIEQVGHDMLAANVICGTANKGIHGVPGISFVLADSSAISRFREAPPRSVYLSAAAYLDAQRRGTVLYTPAIQVCFALHAAIEELSETGGVQARTAQYRRRADLVRSGFSRLGLSILIDAANRSNSVTTLRIPGGLSYERLHDELRAGGFVIYAGQGDLSTSCFRVATMGDLSLATLDRFIERLGDVLRRYS